MSSAYPHHWLSFSLSNNYHHGLLEAFSNSSSAAPLGKTTIPPWPHGTKNLDMHAEYTTGSFICHHILINDLLLHFLIQVGDEQGTVEESPKMVEDFLGGVGGAGAPPAAATAAEDHQLVCGELGSITAGFLRHYPAPGTTVENPGAVTVAAMSTDVAESDQARRPAETFGQRTSIYRGVTR